MSNVIQPSNDLKATALAIVYQMAMDGVVLSRDAQSRPELIRRQSKVIAEGVRTLLEDLGESAGPQE